jgi:hypothetical protein
MNDRERCRQSERETAVERSHRNLSWELKGHKGVSKLG